MASQGLPTVFGGAMVGTNRVFGDVPSLERVFKQLKKYGITHIDTAELYDGSEQLLGEAKAAQQGFTFDTKASGGFRPGQNAGLVQNAKSSLAKLGVDQVDVFYLHSPDTSYPLEKTLEHANTVYKQGSFKRFGLSNYTTEDVQRVYDICKSNGWVLPTVFQGNYSAVARRQEDTLFPLLRRLGMAFYAYSPIAGGFLTKSKQDVLDGVGRMDPNTPIGKLYRGLYNRPSFLEALDRWEAVARDENCSRAELAYRWVMFHSAMKREHGDTLIFGTRTFEQLDQTLEYLTKGPLTEKSVKIIDEVWETVKDEAPLDNFNG